MENQNKYNDPRLTDEEVARLKKIAQNDARMEWLWGSVRQWAGWLAGLLAGIIAFREDIAELFKWLVK